MASFKIIGGKKLSGIVNPQGAKNEALQVISATLLTKEKITISNIPLIIDVLCLMKILDAGLIESRYPVFSANVNSEALIF